MAINQAVSGTPGSKSIVGILKNITEPGTPPTYWNPAASPPAFTPAPATRIPLVEDPDCPGQFLFQIPTSTTSSWADKVYLLTVLDLASSTKDEVLNQISIILIDGDDGGNGIQSVTITFNGLSVKVWGAMSIPLASAATASLAKPRS